MCCVQCTLCVVYSVPCVLCTVYPVCCDNTLHVLLLESLGYAVGTLKLFTSSQQSAIHVVAFLTSSGDCYSTCISL